MKIYYNQTLLKSERIIYFNGPFERRLNSILGDEVCESFIIFYT